MSATNDLTLLYYTANRIPEATATKIRHHLLQTTQGQYPIVSVSQQPISFGYNICAGEIGQSNYNCYKQILTGAKMVKTQYLACCEDDTLYTPAHFTHRPSHEHAFTYNTHTWFAGTKLFWRQKDMSCMGFHICPTKLLITTLTPRFALYPTPPKNQAHWAEPGKFDPEFGIPNPQVATFKTKLPVVTFEYRGSLYGKRKRFGLKDPQSYTDALPVFGNARRLWQEYWHE